MSDDIGKNVEKTAKDIGKSLSDAVNSEQAKKAEEQAKQTAKDIGKSLSDAAKSEQVKKAEEQAKQAAQEVGKGLKNLGGLLKKKADEVKKK